MGGFGQEVQAANPAAAQLFRYELRLKGDEYEELMRNV
jgi:hypothetical protein